MEKGRKEKQELRRQQENAVFNKLMIWFGAALGYEILVLLLRRFLFNYRSDLFEVRLAQALRAVIGVLRFGAPVLTAAAVVWLILWWRQGKKTTLPLVCSWVGAALSVTAIVTHYGRETGASALGALGPVAAVLGVIFFLYQRDFFYSTLMALAPIAALWLYRRGYDSSRVGLVYAAFVMVWAGLAVGVALAWRLAASGGKWRGFTILPSDAVYPVAYVTAGLGAVSLALALALGATAAYYAMLLLVVWIFSMAVYYTVKMM